MRVLRNDEIGFGGSGSTVNMFISGGFEEAPIVGSGSCYTGSLSFFMEVESFWGLTCDSGRGRIGCIMLGRIPLGLKGL